MGIRGAVAHNLYLLVVLKEDRTERYEKENKLKLRFIWQSFSHPPRLTALRAGTFLDSRRAVAAIGPVVLCMACGCWWSRSSVAIGSDARAAAAATVAGDSSAAVRPDTVVATVARAAAAPWHATGRGRAAAGQPAVPQCAVVKPFLGGLVSSFGLNNYRFFFFRVSCAAVARS